MMHVAYRMARTLGLAIACLSHGCGPVAAPEHPIEAVGRQAMAEALRAALVEACRIYAPPPSAPPLHHIAHAVACGAYSQPAAGVTLPPSPPAPPSEAR